MKLHLYIFLPIIILSGILSLWIAYGRIGVERHLDTVNMVMDYDEWENICNQNGYKLEDTLTDLKNRGISSFGVYEDTCKRLDFRGELDVVTGSEILNAYRLTGLSNPVLKELARQNKITANNIYIIFPSDSPYLKKVQEYFLRFLGPQRLTLYGSPSASPVLEAVGTFSEVVNIGIGMPRDIVRKLADKGFYIVPRIENRILDKEKLDFIFKDLAETPNCSTLIFSGVSNEALGYPDLLEQTAFNIKNNKLYFGFIEVPDEENLQKGSMTIANYDITRVVRVISITQAYQQKLNLDQMLEIWSLAVRERNIRLLYIRPLLDPLKDMKPMESNMYYLQLCKYEITQAGYKLGGTGGMGDFGCPRPVALLLGLGIISATLLLFARIFQLSFRNCLLLGSIGFMIFLGGMFVLNSLFSKLCALAGGIFFPLFALVFGFPGIFSEPSTAKQEKQMGRVFFAFKTLWQVSLITLLGSMISMGLLSSTKFFLAVDRFRGVKFIMIVPIFLILPFYIFSSEKKYKFSALLKKIKSFLCVPLQLWQFIAVLLIALLGVFYIMRTGNTTAVPASDFERELRAFLDNILIVRPRFKDFLVGGPVLFLLSYLWYGGKSIYLGILLMLSALGQADFVDTFAHLHTPVLVTFLRIFNGLWIGTIFGLVFVGIYNLLILIYGKFEKWLGRQEN